MLAGSPWLLDTWQGWDPLGSFGGRLRSSLSPSWTWYGLTHRAEGEETRGLESLVYFPLEIHRQENGPSYESKSKYKTKKPFFTDRTQWLGLWLSLGGTIASSRKLFGLLYGNYFTHHHINDYIPSDLIFISSLVIIASFKRGIFLLFWDIFLYSS